MQSYEGDCIFPSHLRYALSVTLGFLHIFYLSEGFIHILRRFCTNFKMRRNYTYSKKVLYIFSISQKDLRRCEGSLKDLYTPTLNSIPFNFLSELLIHFFLHRVYNCFRNTLIMCICRPFLEVGLFFCQVMFNSFTTYEFPVVVSLKL